MENLDFRMRTGAWVGLVLSIGVAGGVVCLSLSSVKISGTIMGLETGTSSGVTLWPLYITYGTMIVLSLASVVIYALILAKPKSAKGRAYAAITAASVIGALAILITYELAEGAMESAVVQAAATSALATNVITGGLSWILAVVSVLQIEKVEDRKTGCLLMIIAGTGGVGVIYLVTRLI